MTTGRRRRILLDMDGVLVNFFKHYLNTFGIHPEALADDNDKFWAIFDSKPVGFFRECPAFIGTREFVESIFKLADKYDCDVEILTAIPRKSVVPGAEREKNEWVMAQKFSRHIHVHIGPYASQKQNHVRPGDILIDDNPLNIEQWVAKGGIGILHTNFDLSFEEAKTALEITDVNAIRVYAGATFPISDELITL